MSNLAPSWVSSPLVVVPLSCFALGLALVPFAISDTEHAAQFYGAFVAAIVAAGAVVGTTALQAELSRREKASDRHAEAIAEAVELYVWMHTLSLEFFYVTNVLGRFLAKQPPITISATTLRSHIVPDVRTRLRNRLVIASRLPAPLNLSITKVLHRADGALDTVCFMPMLAPDAVIPTDQVQFRCDLALYYKDLIQFRRAFLGQWLVQSGAIATLDDVDLAAIAAGHPKAPVLPD